MCLCDKSPTGPQSFFFLKGKTSERANHCIKLVCTFLWEYPTVCVVSIWIGREIDKFIPRNCLIETNREIPCRSLTDGSGLWHWRVHYSLTEQHRKWSVGRALGEKKGQNQRGWGWDCLATCTSGKDSLSGVLSLPVTRSDLTESQETCEQVQRDPQLMQKYTVGQPEVRHPPRHLHRHRGSRSTLLSSLSLSHKEQKRM